MAFLAQVNLSVMAREAGFDPSLPDRGMLWAFNDPFADWYGTQSPSGAFLFYGVTRVDWNAGRHRR